MAANKKARPGPVPPSHETVGKAGRGDERVDAAVHAVLHPEERAVHGAAAKPLASEPKRGQATVAAGDNPAGTSAGEAASPPEPAGAAFENASPQPRSEGDATGRQAASAPTQAAAPVRDGGPDMEALSRNLGRYAEESSKLAARIYGSDGAAKSYGGVDASDAAHTLGQVAEHWFGDPARLMKAQADLTTRFFELWTDSASRMVAGGTPAKPTPPGTDKRFRDPAWREHPGYDFLHRAFLLGSAWANGLVENADGLDDETRAKARFYMRQITSALSPSNFVPTNPELLRDTLRENGENLLRGLKMLAEDITQGKGDLRIRHTDTSKFQVGVNMATTPGKVVFRNDLMELIQYAPSTPQVLARPLLIVPPWINKFYVLDLNPEKSFIRWAVGQGLTVFVVSWVNPDERHADKDFESYMREGVLAALDEVLAITGHPSATAIGYCVGGTLLAVTLAHMAAENDHRFSSATLFTAQVDFTRAGDLKVFADEGQIRALEQQMSEDGFLRGSHMAQAFNMLRPEDLIWSYWVNNYLRGKEPPAFDLLAWNSDSTRMPSSNHSFYLRNCYLENRLARGLMEIAGRMLDIGSVTVPIYNLATREDHIAPALSVYEGSKCFGGQVRYVLSGSGHVAGVVNPPTKGKYGFTVGPEVGGTLEEWLAQATEHAGSWWPDWAEWVRAQEPALVPARDPGADGRSTFGDAPGEYVRAKA